MHPSLAELMAFCFGISFIVTRGWVASSAAEFDMRLGIHVDPKFYEFGSLISGMTFILLGLLSMSGYITLHLQS